MVFATLAFLGAFGADQGLLPYFADLSGPGERYGLVYLLNAPLFSALALYSFPAIAISHCFCSLAIDILFRLISSVVCSQSGCATTPFHLLVRCLLGFDFGLKDNCVRCVQAGRI